MVSEQSLIFCPQVEKSPVVNTLSTMDEFLCAICKDVLLDPQLIVCCGKHFCRTCTEGIKSRDEPCPLCGEDFTTAIDRYLLRHLHSQIVRCHHRDKGCNWEGYYSEFESHLQTECIFAEVICCNPNCRESFQRRHLEKHLQEKCLHRLSRCRYCGYEATHDEILNQHKLSCEKYPYPCMCGTTIMQAEVKHHVEVECPLQQVPCPFNRKCFEKKWITTCMISSKATWSWSLLSPNN